MKRVTKTIKNRSIKAAEVLVAERVGLDHIPRPHENFRYRHFLMPTYLEYVSRVSWADHAVSLETAACLLQMCEEHQPRRVLDTGSGYSSYVLRRYAQVSGADVISVDTDEDWMSKTGAFLSDMKVDTTGLTLWADFQSAPHEPFGLIFHDMAGGKIRTDSMKLMTDLITPGGHLIFDDMQDDAHRAEAKRVTAAANRRYLSMASVTTDVIGRYASVSVG